MNLDMNRIPAHVAIIMDGNGRWAKNRNIPRVMGHNSGMLAMKEIVKKSAELGIKDLTVYAFSTENWKRSEEEVNGIFKLLIKFVDSKLEQLHKENIRVNILGDWSVMSDQVKDRLEKTIGKTSENTGMRFNIALNYGSRAEITHSVKEIARLVKDEELALDDIQEETVSQHLYTGEFGIPDPDLVIRTSGEIRLSNFLMWQLAYAEMVFTDVLWPDFTPEEFEKALVEFQSRDRRFGGRK